MEAPKVKDDFLNEILEELGAFPCLGDITREYEERAIQFIRIFKDIDNMEDLLKGIIENSEKYSNQISYAAFFILCNFYRRNKEFSRYDGMIRNRKYVAEFGEYISFDHLKSMCIIELAKTKNDILNAIQCSKNAIDRTENYLKSANCKEKTVSIGFYHSYAVNVAKGFEDGHLTTPKDCHFLDSAKEYAIIAINGNERYARFHFTMGRLYLIEKQYEVAIDEFNIAIDYEDSSNKEYALRISDYQNYFLRAKTYKNMENLNETIVSKVKDEMDQMRAKNIEVLSFFVAIMSFIIGSIQLANASDSFADKASLIILLFGCMLLVLSGFGKSLSIGRSRNYTYSIVIGIVMILGSLFLHTYLI